MYSVCSVYSVYSVSRPLSTALVFFTFTFYLFYIYLYIHVHVHDGASLFLFVLLPYDLLSIVSSSYHFLFSGVEYIDAIDMYITNRYLEGTFNSCSKVSVPSTGQLALDLMCGEWGASRCTPSKWFYFMGDAENNIYVPFQITYRNTDGPVGPFVPLDPPITPCSKPLNVGIAFA